MPVPRRGTTGVAESVAQIPGATPEEVYARVLADYREEGLRILEASPPSRLRAAEGAAGAFLLTHEVRIEGTSTGTLVHMSVVSPSDWDAHLRLRKREFRKACVLMAIGLGIIAALFVLVEALFAAFSPDSAGVVFIVLLMGGSFLLGDGLVEAVKARARYQQAKRFADARGTVEHFLGR